MKTAILALALTATASLATAQEELLTDENGTEEVALEITAEDFAVVDVSDSDDGILTITTQQNSEYTLTAVACLPLMSAVVDTADNFDELSGSAANAIMEEVVRGTTRHEIASYACDDI